MPLTIFMGVGDWQKYSDIMNLRRVFVLVSILMLTTGLTPAHAFDPNASRVDQVASLKAQYDPQLDAAYSNFMKLKAKLSSDPSTLKSFNAIIEDFIETRATIDKNLADPNSNMKSVEEYIQEELGEFSTSQFKLTQLAAKIKTISCVKGKSIKKVSALAPKCPSGFKKK